MNSVAPFVFFVLFFGLPLSGFGQAAEPSLAPFKPGMTWKVEALPESRRTLTRGERAKAQTPDTGSEAKVVEENTILTKGFRKQILPDEKLERFIRGGLVLVPDESDGGFSIQSLDPDMTRDRISSKNLLEFSWIAPQWKTGTSVVDGVECDVYARPWPVESGDENPQASAGKALWIFAAIGRQDRLPQRLESPFDIRRYTFSVTNPPPELPAGAVLAIHRINEAAKEMAQRYAIPQ